MNRLRFAGLPGFLALCFAVFITPGRAELPWKVMDRLLAEGWESAGIEEHAPVSDEVFLRRVYLDLAGRIPTLDEASAFLASTSPAKRGELIDELLASEAYVNHFFHFWADLLRVQDRAGGGREIADAYADFIRKSLRENRPYDAFVRELLTATGEAADHGAAGYTYRDRGMPLDHMANTVRVFLGTRLECAQCHDHPFDKWTQMDFYHMAAFSYGMQARNRNQLASVDQANRMLRTVVEDRAEQQTLRRALQEITRPVRRSAAVSYESQRLPKLPKDYAYDNGKPGQAIQPAAMFGDAGPISSPDERVEVYAEWMTSPENPRFTKVIANRLWRKVMGYGLVEPVDDWTDLSKPSNPALLDYLAEYLVETGYDMKAFLGAVCRTQAYQAEASLEEVLPGARYLFPGPVLKRMTAEQIWDSVVALVNPEPESADWLREREQELRLAHQRAMREALASYDPEKMVALAKEVAAVQVDSRQKLEALQAEIRVARDAEDRDEIRRLSQEARRVTTEMRNRVREMAYDPALEQVGAVPVVLELPGGETAEVDAMEAVDERGRLTQELRRRLQKAEQDAIEAEMAERGITDPKEKRAFMEFRRGSRNMLRAMHVGSPAPAGHFLQEFGQSDRELIENADKGASVPQALRLLNGDTFPMLSGQRSLLSGRLDHTETAGEGIRTIFLAMLTRPPTAAEEQLVTAALEHRGDAVYDDAIFALLNSPEFLFVQ